MICKSTHTLLDRMRFNMRQQPGRDMLMITAFGVYVTWCVRTINKAYNHEE